MATNIVVGYSPTDFFYVKAKENNTMPTKEDCSNASMVDVSKTCNIDNYNNNKYDCITAELCKNKDNVSLLSKLQNKHSGSDQNYLDTNQEYKMAFTQTINLGIGIILIIGLIAQNRNLQ